MKSYLKVTILLILIITGLLSVCNLLTADKEVAAEKVLNETKAHKSDFIHKQKDVVIY